MKATILRVDAELLRELNQLKSPSHSLSAFVRSILEREVGRRKMAAAADRYGEFLRATPSERSWLDEWNAADLARPPARKRR